ncbi:MG2 domain-containing protein [Pendulispora brunnea]|uniref:MG2 domain-containing protein n=1 Tax=Pendulispora brunnea TaxID=2905690 RepID=A0ABZ2K0T6_9BACT
MYVRLAFLLLLALCALGCPGESKVPVSPIAKKDGGGSPMWKVSKSGVGFRLSNAEAGEDRTPTPPAPSQPLSATDTRKVLDRLPKLAPLPGDEKDFALRAGSMPAPRTGKTVQEAFPPPASSQPPPQAASGPARVLRHQPDGAVELARHLSVTFSKPMVAVTSHGDLAAQQVPVRLTPQPPGQWRWVGTQTLLFEPNSELGGSPTATFNAERFPMATDYEVEVPSMSERWRFATPPPKLVASYPEPHTPVRFDPILFLAFDQSVDPAAVLKNLEVTGNARPVKLHLATAEEVEAERELGQRIKDSMPGRWLAVRPDEPLSPGAHLTVHVRAGTPSREGPKKTTADQSFTFETHGPLRITGHQCGWGQTCRPRMPFEINFSNQLDLAAFDKNLVRVEPPIPQMKVVAQYQSISISGRTRGKTKYKVTVGSALRDEFGQSLGREESVSFTTERSEPELFRADREMTVLDAAEGTKLPVYSVNQPSLSVSLYAVTPQDWSKYTAWIGKAYRERSPGPPPGELVSKRTVSPANNPDELTETNIDLAPALKGGLGHVIVLVEPTTLTGKSAAASGGPPAPKDRFSMPFRSWVQVTRMALSTFRDAEELVTFVSELSTGAGLAGIDVQGAASTSKTGADGIARQPLGNEAAVIARKGNDVAFLSLMPSWQGAVSTRPEIKDEVRWFVFDDRKMYKPGEEVRVKGWIRRSGTKKGGDIGLVDGAAKIRWGAADARGNEFIKGLVEVDKTGSFDLAFKIPDTANLGHSRVNLHLFGATSLGESDAVHGFSIEEFRRPEFEVTTETTEGPHLVGDHAVTTMTAAYYAGGGLPNTEVNWTVTRDQAVYTPPNRSDYVFGKQPDLFESFGMRGHSFGPHHGDSVSESWRSVTDGQGKHRLRIDFEAREPAYPMNLHVEARLQDVNRQTFASSSNILVHPGSVYVGIRRARAFVRAGEVIDVATIATDIDGHALRGRKVTVSSARLDWEQQGTEFRDVDKDVRTCEVTSGDDAVHCNLPTMAGGRYRVTAWVTDDQGRKNQSEMLLWVSGEDMPSDARMPEDALTVIADKEEYQVGETAELLVMSPFPGEAVVTVGRQGIVHLQRVKMVKSSTTVRIPIEPTWLPNAQVSVQVTGLAPRKNEAGEVDTRLPKRPAYATGTVPLKIAPRDRKLAITVKPREAKIEPGGRTVVELDVRDAGDRPAANTQLAVVVVDEAVLALSNYQTPDPMRTFYASRPNGVQSATLLEYVRIAKTTAAAEANVAEDSMHQSVGGAARRGAFPAPPPPPMAPSPAMLSAPAGMAMEKSAAGGEASGGPIHLRTNLTPLAAFVPRVMTDAKGHASVEVKLPDSLTRYRIMAIAAEGAARFGSGESAVTARLPLMVRPSAPRFLNFGDRFELPIVVQNQTDQAMTVDVAARGANADVAATGKRVTVPANDRVEVRLAANARRAGTARFQVGAVAGRWADASQIELPVWTPATTEAFATYGQIDEGAIAQPVKVPSGIVTEYGGVSVTTSSTALQALTDAVLYLVNYPFECNEQIASRVIAIASLKDVLAAFQAKDLPPPDKLIERVQADAEQLRRFQQPDGGWSFWGNHLESWPFLSVHIAHAMARAKDKGFKVDPSMLERAKKYMRDIDGRIPSWYSVDARRAIKAYALFTRHILGDTDRASARRLVAEAGGAAKLPIEADGWLLRVLTGDAGSQAELAAIRTHLGNRVSETAGAAHFVTQYEDGAHVLLASDRRADGVILESLIADQPKSDLIAKIVTGLLAHRTAGHWSSTQENAFVLIALDRYFRTYEGTKPDFVARAWLGDKLASEHAFRGRSTDRANTDIPMRLLDAGSKITLAKDGPGRLYFRIGMTYAPADLKPPPADHGFTVSRSYEAVDRPDDVRRDADGTVRVKAGARVRIRLTMVTPARRYHVALVDPLPAGLEPLNAALAVTESVPGDPKAPTNGPMWFWAHNWVQHENMRDNRVEAFASLVWDGVHPYTYVARATTPGTYVVPPPKAEEMYNPETFGRGPGDRLIVE